MLTHLVFFWAKDGLSAADTADFESGLRALLAIPSVVDGSVGVPAATDRPTVERSYAFALMLRFKDIAAHDAYQVDPIHNAFHARCLKYWSKVVVYDFVDPPTTAG
jgi:hypothetical protein